MATSIISIGTSIPGEPEFATYSSGKSLHDYDVIVFDTSFPSYNYDGDSLSDWGSKQLKRDISHWDSELDNAITDGKTVFILLAESENLSVKTGQREIKGRTTINYVTDVNNYSALPFTLKVVNSKGSKIKVCDTRFSQLYEAIKDQVEYLAYIPGVIGTVVFSTVRGTNTLGAVIKLKEKAGHVVLLPYFSLGELTEEHEDGETYWTKEALKIGRQFTKQIIEVDKSLRKSSSTTPAPNWVADMPTSKKAATLQKKIDTINASIRKSEEEKEKVLEQKQKTDAIKSLLYENGSILETEIENALKMMGYEVSNFRDGALEIDHVIVSPDGKRLVGEAEGKDSSAIGISKFRQLESNINEDFERDEVTEPAQGVLFGNGYRLKNPSERPDEFTDKCYTNAKRLGTALVKTSDLYPVALYLSDHPDDAIFKTACRKALEETKGTVVTFPEIPTKPSSER